MQEVNSLYTASRALRAKY